MKRRALLIGNTAGLPGVKVDLINYSKFLVSDTGGQWNDSEILFEINPSRSSLLYSISLLKAERPDFVWVVYSGHGAYSRETMLEINQSGEIVYESELRGIASRQVLIFDCCREVIKTQLSDAKSYLKSLLLMESRKNLRPVYETRIMQSIEQQASLYACSIGESSYDTNEGGIYTNCLLSSLKPESTDQFKLLSTAQEEARPKTRKKAFEIYSKNQNPDQSLPKCISSQQLIISINPNYSL